MECCSLKSCLVIFCIAVLSTKADAQLCFDDEDCPGVTNDQSLVYCCGDNQCCNWDPSTAFSLGIGAVVGIVVCCLIVLTAAVLICVCCCACTPNERRRNMSSSTSVITTSVPVHPPDYPTQYQQPKSNGYSISLYPQPYTTKVYHQQLDMEPTNYTNPLNNEYSSAFCDSSDSKALIQT